MTYAMNSYTRAKSIRAGVFDAGDDRSILSFTGDDGATLTLHIPLAVAQATADAFNAAIQADAEARAHAFKVRERISELPADQIEMLQLKGMI